MFKAPVYFQLYHVNNVGETAGFFGMLLKIKHVFSSATKIIWTVFFSSWDKELTKVATQHQKIVFKALSRDYNFKLK